MPLNASQRQARPRKGAPAAARLTRDDWLDAAFAAAIEGGFGAVRVLLLADALGVTRGSFYWHFADHADLVQALIDRWYRHEIAKVNRQPQYPYGEPAKCILAVLDEVIALTDKGRKNDRFEQALRSLASQDAAVAAQLEEVDRGRLQMLHGHYAQLTGSDSTARELSALLYLAVVGSHQALNRPSADARMADYLKSIIARHLVHALDKSV